MYASSNKPSKIAIWLAGIVIGSGLFFGALRYGDSAYYFARDLLTAQQFAPSQEIEALASDIALTAKGRRILMASEPQIEDAATFNKKCPNSDADYSLLGCYYIGNVYVFDIQNDDLYGIQQTTLAHEMLHAAWERLPSWRQEELATQIDIVYNSHRDEIDEHLTYYGESERLNEMHSIIGTQYRDLGDELERYYAQYFENRIEIVEYYERYSGVLAKLSAQIEALGSEIERTEATIKENLALYEDNLKALDADIQRFNSECYHGCTNFNGRRNALEVRRDNLEADRASLNALITETNRKIDDYNKLATKAGVLYESMDSKTAIEKPNQ